MITSHDYKSFSFSSTFNASPLPKSLDIESFDGNLSLLERLPEDGLAVIGTRTPQRRSMLFLEKVFQELKHSNLIIISGLARGIDSKAHELAIENGLKTIAILGSGINLTYPAENRILRRKIVESGGLVISQFERDTQPIKYNFVNRNQLIAGLSKATWVVEAAAISGTLNTTSHASKFSRDIYATSAFPGDTFFEGNEKLLSERRPDRYPKAEPVFGADSFSSLWPILARDGQSNLFSQLASIEPSTDIQRWVLEIKSEFGRCPVQSLMNRASARGLTLGKFYLEYEKELESGLLIQDADGCVHLKIR